MDGHPYVIDDYFGQKGMLSILTILIIHDYMKLNEIKKLEKFIVNNPKKETIKISVYLVSRASFNDERLILSKTFILNNLINEDLIWFDKYLGVKKDNNEELALAYLDGYTLYLLERNEENINVIKVDALGHIFSDDYDEYHIISANII